MGGARLSGKWYLATFLVLAAANVFIFRELSAKPELTVAVLAVTKGEAVLLRGPTGVSVLVNGGSDASILRALGSALPFFDRSIDAVVATDPNTTNIGGLADVFARYRVSYYLSPGIPDSKVASRALEVALKSEPNLQQVVAKRGTRLNLGGGAYADVLAPDRNASAMNASEGAIVLRVVYGSTSFLLTSDLQPSVARWLDVLDRDDGELVVDVSISSSTPPGIFHSDGVMITKD